jgi:Holliday junction resolvase
VRRAAKQDGNQAAIVAALRVRGVIVVDLSRLGFGVPDLLCGCHGRTALLEVKLPQSDYVAGGIAGKTRRAVSDYDPQFGFTPDEVEFHARWRGEPIVTVRSVGDALNVFGLD